MDLESVSDLTVLSRFDRIRMTTECPYARGSGLIGVSADADTSGLVLLSTALVDAAASQVDGVVFEISDPEAGGTIESLRRTIGELLRALTTAQGRADSIRPASVLQSSWWFRFDETNFFVSAFGPCYARDSSRFAFDADETYVLFLAAESFARRRAQGEDHLPIAVKRSIRGAYNDAGRKYDLSLTLSPFEAYRIVKPATYGAPPVRWWEE